MVNTLLLLLRLLHNNTDSLVLTFHIKRSPASSPCSRQSIFIFITSHYLFFAILLPPSTHHPHFYCHSRLSFLFFEPAIHYHLIEPHLFPPPVYSFLYLFWSLHSGVLTFLFPLQSFFILSSDLLPNILTHKILWISHSLLLYKIYFLT